MTIANQGRALKHEYIANQGRAVKHECIANQGRAVKQEYSLSKEGIETRVCS